MGAVVTDVFDIQLAVVSAGEGGVRLSQLWQELSHPVEN